MIIKYLSFPVGNRPYGGGGWSKNAKYKPSPEVKTLNVNRGDIKYKNKSVFIHGLRKLKVNIFTNRGKVLRQDYPQIEFDTVAI
jgi:hypothetical protein